LALAAVHAARAATIRHLRIDDIDLPNRRITLTGHSQRLGELTHHALRTWLEERRARWPHTPNRHVLISTGTALGTQPVSIDYLKRQFLNRGVYLEHVRGDRVLQEALAVGPDPLHLALVFNVSHTAASSYAAIAQKLLDDELDRPSTASTTKEPVKYPRSAPPQSRPLRRGRGAGQRGAQAPAVDMTLTSRPNRWRCSYTYSGTAHVGTAAYAVRTRTVSWSSR